MGSARAFPRAVVVVADDDPATREHVAGLLRERGLTVVAVGSGQKAIDVARATMVDLVVLDTSMPGLSGTDACKVIKTITKDRFVPVVLLTPPGEPTARLRSSRTGADDHVTKPVDEGELLACIENMLRVKHAHDDVAYAKSELRYTSLHGELRSGPGNGTFHQRLEHEFGEARRHLDPLACCILALDDFRALVDARGPGQAGQLLDEVFERIRRALRATDVVTHFRTAEFGLLLLNTRPARALTLSDRLIAEVAQRPYDLGGTSVDLTIGIGVGLYPSGPIRSHTELLDAASIAVARARVAGPNRVCVVQQQGYIFRPTLPGAA